VQSRKKKKKKSSAARKLEEQHLESNYTLGQEQNMLNHHDSENQVGFHPEGGN